MTNILLNSSIGSTKVRALLLHVDASSPYEVYVRVLSYSCLDLSRLHCMSSIGCQCLPE